MLRAYGADDEVREEHLKVEEPEEEERPEEMEEDDDYDDDEEGGEGERAEASDTVNEEQQLADLLVELQELKRQLMPSNAQLDTP